MKSSKNRRESGYVADNEQEPQLTTKKAVIGSKDIDALSKSFSNKNRIAELPISGFSRISGANRP